RPPFPGARGGRRTPPASEARSGPSPRTPPPTAGAAATPRGRVHRTPRAPTTTGRSGTGHASPTCDRGAYPGPHRPRLALDPPPGGVSPAPPAPRLARAPPPVLSPLGTPPALWDLRQIQAATRRGPFAGCPPAAAPRAPPGPPPPRSAPLAPAPERPAPADGP